MTQSVGVVLDSQVGVVRCSLGGIIGAYRIGHLCTLDEMQAQPTGADKRALIVARAQKKFAEDVAAAACTLQSA